jgi:hypothetical protein
VAGGPWLCSPDDCDGRPAEEIVGRAAEPLYASRLTDSSGWLADGARTASEDSIGAANAVAHTLPASEGARLADAAAIAFTDALGIGFAVAGAVALLAVIPVRRHLRERRDRVAPALQPQPA